MLCSVPGGPRFPCCSQLTLRAPLSLSHRGLKGTTLANSFLRLTPRVFLNLLPTASLPLPIRSPPHSVLASGIHNGPAGFSLLPWLLFLPPTAGSDHLTIRQTLEGPDPRSLSRNQKNEWLPSLHFLYGNIHHNEVPYLRSASSAGMVGTTW